MILLARLTKAEMQIHSIGYRGRKTFFISVRNGKLSQFHFSICRCKMERFIKVPEKLLLQAVKICQEMSREIPENARGLFGQLQVTLRRLQENSKRDEDNVTCENLFTITTIIALIRIACIVWYC